MPAFLDDSPRSLILVSAAFWPASEAGVARISSFVRYLPELGFLPAVVTTDGAALPEGCDDRIALHRVKYRDPRPGGVPYSADRLPLWRRLARDVLALPDRYRRWSRRAASVAWALARERHAPVLVSVPPLSAAWHLARSRRSGDPPLFIDFRDGWMVDPVRADYYRNPIRRAIEARMERTTLAAAAAILPHLRDSPRRFGTEHRISRSDATCFSTASTTEIGRHFPIRRSFAATFSTSSTRARSRAIARRSTCSRRSPVSTASQFIFTSSATTRGRRSTFSRVAFQSSAIECRSSIESRALLASRGRAPPTSCFSS